MTITKLRSVIEFYCRWLDTRAVCQERPEDPSHLDHLLWMTTQCLGKFLLERGIEEDTPHTEIDKAHRWLGYIQGCLLCRGHFTLTELRDHSRS